MAILLETVLQPTWPRAVRSLGGALVQMRWGSHMLAGHTQAKPKRNKPSVSPSSTVQIGKSVDSTYSPHT
jgi:hypothetical protein